VALGVQTHSPVQPPLGRSPARSIDAVRAGLRILRSRKNPIFRLSDYLLDPRAAMPTTRRTPKAYAKVQDREDARGHREQREEIAG